VREVVTTPDDSSVALTAKPDFKVLASRLKQEKNQKDLPKVQKAIGELKSEQLEELVTKGFLVLEGHKITSEELQVTKEYKGDKTKNEPAWDDNVLVILDIAQDEHMRTEGLAREVMNRVQKLRKKAGIHPTDPIEAFYQVDPKSEIAQVIHKMGDFITHGIGIGLSPLSAAPPYSMEIIQDEANVIGVKLLVSLRRLSFGITKEYLAGSNERIDVESFLLSRDYHSLLKHLEQGKYEFTLNDQKYVVQLGKDIFKNVYEMLKATK